MSSLYIRLPSKAVADSAPPWLGLSCPFALVSDGGAIEQEGEAPLSDLSGTITKIQRVVLLLAGSDVTLLRVKVPPLSSARLKAALPNLAEEQLLSDPAACAFAAGSSSGGLRTIAVTQRAWLDLLTRTFIASGAHNISALPAQLCLSSQPGQSDQHGMVTAAISEHGANIDLTLRLSEQEGIGISILIDPDANAALEVMQTLCALAPTAPVRLYVPQATIPAYQKALDDNPALNERISVSIDNWTRWIAGAHSATLDLMAGSGANTGHRFDWKYWRWPLVLAAAVLLVNISALNIDWWRMKREAGKLRTAMVKIYRSAYPNESAIIDPIAQMQQKVSAARRNSGLVAMDDFAAITAAFGEAWSSIAPAAGVAPTIAALEYRERSLFVRLKPIPDRGDGLDGEALAQRMKGALAKRDLSLDLASTRSSEIIWQIRGAK